MYIIDEKYLLMSKNGALDEFLHLINIKPNIQKESHGTNNILIRSPWAY